METNTLAPVELSNMFNMADVHRYIIQNGCYFMSFLSQMLNSLQSIMIIHQTRYNTV